MSYYVITRTFLEDQSVKDAVMEMSRVSAEIFRKQPGLLEIKSLISENETHISTYLVWEDQQSHEACMQSKDFNEVTRDWTRYMESGQIKFELETYQVM